VAVQSLSTNNHPYHARVYTVGELADRIGNTPAIVKEIRDAGGGEYTVFFDTLGHDLVVETVVE
jgi:hypothetical protein